jgi:hypothetical protein
MAEPRGGIHCCFSSSFVIAGRDPAIHAIAATVSGVSVDARVKSGHDNLRNLSAYLSSIKSIIDIRNILLIDISAWISEPSTSTC